MCSVRMRTCSKATISQHNESMFSTLAYNNEYVPGPAEDLHCLLVFPYYLCAHVERCLCITPSYC